MRFSSKIPEGITWSLIFKQGWTETLFLRFSFYRKLYILYVAVSHTVCESQDENVEDITQWNCLCGGRNYGYVAFR